MKSTIVNVFTAASLAIAAPALAADMPAGAKAKCGMCHTVDKKLVGPSFMDISAKFKGDPDAVAKIMASTVKGGSFGWKLGAMPPTGKANDPELKAIAEFIAGLAK